MRKHVSDLEGAVSVLILGESRTAKTNYVLQLYGRLIEESGALKLRKMSTNLAPFEAGLQRLGEGLEADHTPSGTYNELPLALVGANGENVDILWPDYAGEQVKEMIERRQIKPDWQERLRRSRAWLLFIRPALFRDPEDIFQRPISQLLKQPPAPTNNDDAPWSDQSRLIELLQLLLFARGSSALHPVAHPALGVVLSCWDELNVPEGTRPNYVLREYAPLLNDFINTRWTEAAHVILGVAPLGRQLSKTTPDDDFVDRGPEHQGFAITPDGQRTPDLTVPLIELLRRV